MDQEKMDEIKWMLIRKRLFAEDKMVSDFLLQIHSLLVIQHQKYGFTLNKPLINELKIKILQSVHGQEELINTMVAVLLFDPGKTINFLKALAQAIDVGKKESPKFIQQVKGEYRSFGSSDFMPGFIQGSFETLDWAFHQYGPDQIFNELLTYFQGTIPLIITTESDLQAWTDRVFALKCYSSEQKQFSFKLGEQGQKFSGKLANIISKMLPLNEMLSNDCDNKLKRTFLLTCITATKIQPDQYVSLIGRIVLQQLHYAYFKMLTASERQELFQAHVA
ncbi:hypothetical protein ACFL2U_01510 [Patescibacteria group bacterium]